MDMTVQELNPDARCVALAGRLDTLGVDRVETRFNAATAAAGRDILVDLTEVSFVSSMGVRLLITAARSLRSRGHRMVLFAAQPTVTSTLEMIEMDQVIPLVADLDAAKNRLAAEPR